jgi:hypothetical protein
MNWPVPFLIIIPYFLKILKASFYNGCFLLQYKNNNTRIPSFPVYLAFYGYMYIKIYYERNINIKEAVLWKNY